MPTATTTRVGAALQRVDVGTVVGDRVRDAGQQRIVAGSVVVGRHAELGRVGRRLGDVLVGELALPHRHGHEVGHRGSPALLVVDGLGGLLGGTCLVGVGEHVDQRRLVRDERDDVVGMSRDEGEGGDRPAAAREQLHRSGVERGDDGVDVRGLLLGVVVGAAVAPRAAAEAAGVVRDDGAVGKVRRESAEPTGVHRLTDQHQRRSSVLGRQRPVDVVGHGGSGHVERAVLGHVLPPIRVLDHEDSDRSGAR